MTWLGLVVAVAAGVYVAVRSEEVMAGVVVTIAVGYALYGLR